MKPSPGRHHFALSATAHASFTIPFTVHFIIQKSSLCCCLHFPGIRRTKVDQKCIAAFLCVRMLQKFCRLTIHLQLTHLDAADDDDGPEQCYKTVRVSSNVAGIDPNELWIPPWPELTANMIGQLIHCAIFSRRSQRLLRPKS